MATGSMDVSPGSPPIGGGFFYLSFPRWALVVDGPAAEIPPEPHGPRGALRGGKMAEFRIESGI